MDDPGDMPLKRLMVVLALGMAGLAAGAGSGTAPAQTSMATMKSPLLRNATQVSANWSGYVAAGSDAAATTPSFTGVAGRWVQPRARCTVGRSSSSAFWVGIGGASDASHALEQIGTQVSCNARGKATYSMWYELVPAASVTIKYKVFPGNVITASVTVKGTRVTVQIRNLSRRTRFTKVLSMSSPDTSSAEWVAEAPSACFSADRCVVVPLTDFGTVSFTNATAIADGHHGTIGDAAWAATPVVLDSSRQGSFAGNAPSTDGAVPSLLSPDGAAFNVEYQATLAP
jgi:Peptidase A4 family